MKNLSATNPALYLEFIAAHFCDCVLIISNKKREYSRVAKRHEEKSKIDFFSVQATSRSVGSLIMMFIPNSFPSSVWRR